MLIKPKPTLFVVAGCNGSGKSTFSKSLINSSVTPFDYDKKFLEVYKSLQDFDLKDEMCRNKTFDILTEAITDSIAKNIDFCYETNFNSTPMYWVDKFKKSGYNLNMIFFCLNSIDEAKRRVQIRFENGGHFVPDNEVKERFNLGYSNLDANYTKFDTVELYDSSGYNVTPTHIVSLLNGEIVSMSKYPIFLERLLPNITLLINSFITSPK